MREPRISAVALHDMTLQSMLECGRIDFKRMPYDGGDAREVISSIGAGLRFHVHDAASFFAVVTPQAHGDGPYRIFPAAPVHMADYAGKLVMRDRIPVFDGALSLHNYGHHPRSGAPLFAGTNGWVSPTRPSIEEIIALSDPSCTRIVYSMTSSDA